MSETNETCDVCGCPMLGCFECCELYCPECSLAEAERAYGQATDEAVWELEEMPW